ncbi:MAG TPA: helicase-related protein [Pyrinomonadaceae bacterium]|nr:helicase-related protein [Pyrinomonadaceae bacterium]
MKVKRPNTEAVLAGLKDFQLRTVDYVFQRLYVDQPQAKRFLIADEVGLGKTLVARGLIAKTIDRLWSTVKRIDIVYICSNAEIARQNINRLNVTGGEDFVLPSRITLLPIHLKNLNQNRINFISFTPGTSFELPNKLGKSEERVLLYWLLQSAWGLRGNGPLNVLQGTSTTEIFRRQVKSFRRNHEIDESLAGDFAGALERRIQEERERGERDIRERFADLCVRFGRTRKHIPPADRHDRLATIGELRGLLASTCLIALEPDLIILDEFQRFKHLLDGSDEASHLARGLFDYGEARVLLLSATPYKMYTLPHEAATDDHYQDFVRTARFLFNDAAEADRFQELLEQYRRELFRLSSGEASRLLTIKRELELALRKVMVRTEKLATSEDRDGMLQEVAAKSQLSSGDLRDYVSLQNIARMLDQPDTLQYWKSAPYLLHFMDGYKLKDTFALSAQIPEREKQLARALGANGLLLNWRDIEFYRAIDPGNDRLRALLDDTVGKGAWQLLWVPPSLPYYQCGPPFAQPGVSQFTKRLIFSSWRVVPRVIAALVSYEAERRAIRSFETRARNTAESRKRRRPLLRFARTEGRLSGMPVIGLLYPSVTLARECDPLQLQPSSPDHELRALADVFKSISGRIDQLLAEVVPRNTGKAEDEAWYWAAPILLDLKFDSKATLQWLSQENLAEIWSGAADDSDTEEGSLWADHVAHAQRLVKTHDELGEPPGDLADVLAFLALGSPAITTLRSLLRVGGGGDKFTSLEIRTSAATVAWAFRHLFNVPESMSVIRGMSGADKDQPYWRRVLDYGAKGCLQAVLDEYAHVLKESLGLLDASPESVSQQIAEAMRRAISLRTSTMVVDNISVDSAGKKLKIERQRLRVHFAARFGEEKTEGEAQLSRAEQVRESFNSPFWPFVLATTSVGQEGLDFHHYCHAVVHWNIPSNPVDLEQREGRVHRYKGHAVRKNVARGFRSASLSDGNEDPWQAMFEAAKAARPQGTSDIIPFWVYQLEGGAHIERHVPALPFSSEREQLSALKRSLVVYRMVFGQNRQEDLTNYLVNNVPASEIKRVSEELRITLEPPSG